LQRGYWLSKSCDMSETEMFLFVTSGAR